MHASGRLVLVLATRSGQDTNQASRLRRGVTELSHAAVRVPPGQR